MDALGAKGTAADPAGRLAKAGSIGGLQLLDARLVCGRDHLVAAYEHAERAMREGRNAAKALTVEFVLYASGERQIADALAKMGIRSDTTEFAIVSFGGADIVTALEALALTKDDAVLDASRQKLRAFGLTDAEIDSVPEDRQADLVLERIAMVDLLK